VNDVLSNISILTRGIQSFPALPAVVARILELTSDPESSVDDFLDMIQCDPSLTAVVLKLSNSAFYGQVRNVGSLKQAISVLGINEIRNVVVARAVFNSFKQIDHGGRFDIRSFWLHSFICGLTAKILAGEDASADDFFIIGLIHDIGKLVLLNALPLSFFEVIENHSGKPYDLFHCEKSVLGTTHADIGMALLKRWMFPDKLVKAVGFHHAPEKSGKPETIPALIYFADMVSYLTPSTDPGELDALLSDPLNQSRADLAGILWDEVSLSGYLNELNLRKDEARETFALIYS